MHARLHVTHYHQNILFPFVPFNGSSPDRSYRYHQRRFSQLIVPEPVKTDSARIPHQSTRRINTGGGGMVTGKFKARSTGGNNVRALFSSILQLVAFGIVGWFFYGGAMINWGKPAIIGPATDISIQGSSYTVPELPFFFLKANGDT